MLNCCYFQKMWNKEWKKLKRESDRDLNILMQEEYFEDIAERSAHYNLNKVRYIEHSVEVQNDIDINIYSMSNDEYYNGINIIMCLYIYN